jgi:hypothetical protein
MSTIPLTVLELLKCEFEPSALRRGLALFDYLVGPAGAGSNSLLDAAS